MLFVANRTYGVPVENRSVLLSESSRTLPPSYEASGWRHESGGYQGELRTANSGRPQTTATHVSGGSALQTPSTAALGHDERAALTTNGVLFYSQSLPHRNKRFAQRNELFTGAESRGPAGQNERWAVPWGTALVTSFGRNNNNNNDGSGGSGDNDSAYPLEYLLSHAYNSSQSATSSLRGGISAAAPFDYRTDYRATASQQSLMPLRFYHIGGRANLTQDFSNPVVFDSASHMRSGEKPQTRGDESLLCFPHGERREMPSSSRHFDPYAQSAISECQPGRHAAFFSSLPQTASNRISSVMSSAHHGQVALGGMSIHQHHQQHFQRNTRSSELQPPPPLPPPPLPQAPQLRLGPRQGQQRAHQPPLFREAVSDTPEHTSFFPVQRTQRRQERAFFEFFGRLRYRHNNTYQRRHAQETSLQRGAEHSLAERNTFYGRRTRNGLRRLDFTLPAPSSTFIHSRSQTPPHQMAITRATHTTRSAFHFLGSDIMRRAGESHTFEATFAPDVDNMSYEELLELAESIGRVERGVPRERLLQLRVTMQPVHFRSRSLCEGKCGATSPLSSQKQPASLEESKSEEKEKEKEEEPVICCVCLDSFCVGQTATHLPCCRHFLHEDCAGRWFEGHFRCPICTRDVRNTEQ